jgi:hypothetical protein
MVQRGLSQTDAAREIGILQTSLSKLLHRPSPGMHRETAEKLARWDQEWSAATYRARRADLYETLRARGQALGQASKGKSKKPEHVKKMRAGLARTMASRHRGQWQRSHMKKMRVKAKEATERRVASGAPAAKRRGAEVGQKIAATLRAKGPLYIKATSTLRRFAMQGGASLDDYLLLEYHVRASMDAVKVVRKAIKKRKGKRPRDYTLVEVLERLAKGDSAKQIAERWVLEQRRAQVLVAMARSVDNRAL